MYWAISYFVEVIKLYLAVFCLAGYRVKWEKGKAIYLLLIGLTVIVVSALSLEIKLRTGIITLFILLTIIVLLQKLGDWMKVMCAYLLIGLADAALAGLLCSNMGWSSSQIITNHVQDMLLNSLSLGLLLLLICLKKVSKGLVSDIKINSNIHILILLPGLLGFIVCIIPIQRKALDMGNRRSAGEISLGMVIFLLMLFYCFYYIGKSERQDVIKKECVFLLKRQKQYYEKLLAREEETKRFRHDIKNHLFVLQKLCGVNGQHRGEAYLQGMLKESNRLGIKIETGNLILDIVAEDVLKEEDGILFEWHGLFPANTKISDVDLCVIFSNILRNAREEVLEMAEKKIVVFIKIWKKSLSIICMNPINKDLISEKSGEHRGLGLMNVETIVKKYKGEMEIEKNEEFKVKIVFYDIIV